VAGAPVVQPINVALGPTCPCTPAPLPIKKVDLPKKSDLPKKGDGKPAKKRDDPSKRASRAPPPVRDDYGPPVRLPPVGIGRYGGGYGRGPIGYPGRRAY
jgi:hypothetical protein